MQDLEAIPGATRPILTLANAVKTDGKPVAPPVLYRTVKTKDGRQVRVAIIGLIGRSPFQPPATATTTKPDEPEKPWTVKDPAETLRALLPEARKKADLVVVLFAAMRDEARRLATDVPGVDLMIAGLEGGVGQQVEKVGETALVQNSDRGRFAAQLGLTLGPDKRPTAFDMRIVAMSDKLPDDPDMARLVQQFGQKQAVPSNPTGTNAVHPTANETTRTAPLVQRASIYAGSYACGSCHAAEFKQWKDSKHAIAMQTLERKDNGVPARRPDCVSCHVVGFEKPDGFNLQSPRWDLRDVGCESCHGPSAAHVVAKRAGRAESGGVVLKPTKELCISCHTKDNSPSFDYDKYLPHVMHEYDGKLPELPHHGMTEANTMAGHS